jgi:hypothetical protein
MKLWVARDTELDMIDIFTKKPLWDGHVWDQDGDYCAALIPDDADILFKHIPAENELIEIDIVIGDVRVIQPPEQPNHKEDL